MNKIEMKPGLGPMKPFFSEDRNDSISDEDDGLYEEYGVTTGNQDANDVENENDDDVYEEYISNHAGSSKNDQSDQGFFLEKLIKKKWLILLTVILLLIVVIAVVLSLIFSTPLNATETTTKKAELTTSDALTSVPMSFAYNCE